MFGIDSGSDSPKGLSFLALDLLDQLVPMDPMGQFSSQHHLKVSFEFRSVEL